MAYAYDKSATSFKVFSGGFALKDAAQRSITRVSIEASIYLSRYCELEFFGDSGADYAYQMSPETDIAVLAYGEGSVLGDVLFKGKVRTIEVVTDEGSGTRTIVRAYDASQDMLAGTKTTLFKDMTYSEVVKKVARPYGVVPLFGSKVASTSQKFDTIVQVNETDWDFICRLAREMGWVAFIMPYLSVVTRMSAAELYFGEAGKAKSAPGSPTSRRGFEVGDGRVISLKATVTGAGLVPSAGSAGWDSARESAALSSVSLDSKAYAGHDTMRDAKGYMSTKAVSRTSLERMARSNAEATMLGKGFAARIAGSAVDVELVARGHPAVHVNDAILIDEAYANTGDYAVSAISHDFTSEFGFLTTIYCTGREDRSLGGLAGAEARRPVLTGVYPAIVNSIEDPDKRGRVNLTFPWLDSAYVSGWARIVQMGAGKGVGWQALPAPKDEVLVAFENGQLETPYVIGGIAGKGDGKVSVSELMKDGSPVKQVFTSKAGHQLIFDDEGDDSGITIRAKNGSTCTVVLHDKDGISITTKGEGKVVINSAADVSVKAGKNASVEAADVTLKSSGKVRVEGTGALTVSGSSVTVDASTSAKITGATVSIEASGPLTLKGAVVNIN